MKNYLSEKLKALTPYTPIEGNYKIRLDANESSISVSKAALERFQARLDTEPLNRYPDPFAAELIQKYSEFYNINPSNVVAGNGSDELISVILSSFLDKGDKMIIVTPDFSMYAFYAGMIGASVIDLSKDESLIAHADGIIKICKRESPKIVILSNPCNPTGQGIKKAELTKLLSQCGCLVIIDEAYMDFWGEEESLLNDAGSHDNLIVLKTMSKALGCAGLRLGFAVAKEYIINALKAAKSPYNVNTLSQILGCEVLCDKEYLRENIKILKDNKTALENSLKVSDNRIGKVIPTVTNFVLIEFESGEAAEKVFEGLLSASIAVRRISGKYLRVTSGDKAENEVFLFEFLKICGEMKK